MLLQRALHLQAVSLYVQSPLPCKDLLGSIPNPLTVQHPPGAALQLPHHPGGITGMLFTRVHLRDTTKTYHLAIIGKMVSHS